IQAWNILLEQGGLGEYGAWARRVNCLGALGYTAEEIPGMMKGTPVESWTPQQVTDNALTPGMQGAILRGETTQAEQLGNCAYALNNFGYTFLGPEDLQGGRQIPYPDTEPPVVISADDPTQAPDPTGPRSRQPSGRQVDWPGLAAGMLKVWNILQGWKAQKQQQGWDININWPGMPGAGRVPAGPGQYPQGGNDMAYVNTSLFMPGGEGGGSWQDLIGGIGRAAVGIWGPNQARPGGAPMQYTGNGGGFDFPGLDIVA
ncbi:unnamed protein product, partial [marine sediment metagenome]